MSYRINLSAIVKLLFVVFASIISIELFAQDPEPSYAPVVTRCLDELAGDAEKYITLFSDYRSTLDGFKYYSGNPYGANYRATVTAKLLYSNGTEKDITDSIGEPYFYIKTSGNYLSELTIKPTEDRKPIMPAEFFGQTIEFTVRLTRNAEVRIQKFQFEILGAPDVYNVSDDFEYAEEYDIYHDNVCEGDEIHVKLGSSGNMQYPYATDFSNTSYLGNTYESSISWRMVYPDESSNDNYKVGTSDFTISDITTGESGVYILTPMLNVGTCKIPLTDHYIIYSSPVETKVSFNGVEGNAFEICDDTNSSVQLFFTHDGAGYSNVDVSLSYTNDQNGEVVDLGTQVGDRRQTFSLGKLKAINDKNTTYTFSYKTIDTDEFYEANCERTGSFTVLVREKGAKITFDPIDDICEGGSITANASVEGNSLSDYTYSWSFAETNFGTSTTANYTFAEGITGDQNLSFTVSNKGCDVTETTKVHINALPKLSVSDEQEICYGSDVTLTATSDQNPSSTIFTWSPAGGTESTSGNSSTYTVAPTETTTYSVVAKNNDTGCESKPSPINVKVNPLPKVTSITPSQWALCQVDESVNLQATTEGGTGNFTYYWSWTDNDGDHSAETTSASYTIAGLNSTTSVTVSLSLKDDKGCESASPYTITLTVNEKPTVNVDDFSMCDGTTGQTEILDYNGALTYEITAATAGAPAASYSSGVCYVNSNLANTEVKKYKYNVKATTSNGCSTTTQFEVTINPLPDVELSADKAIYCLGDMVTLSATTSTANVSYSWKDASDTEISNKKDASVTPSAAGTYTYTLTITNKTTNCQTVKSISVNVVDNPIKPIISASPTSVCSNADDKNITLSVTNVEAGVTYTWYNQANAVVGTGASLTIEPTETTSYYAVAKNASDCGSEASDAVKIDFYVSPLLSATKTEFDICKNVSQTLSVSAVATNDLEYYWSDGVVTTEGTRDVTLDATAYYTVYAKDIVTGCISNYIAFTVNVHSIGDIVVTPATQDVCVGDNATLTVNVTPWVNDYDHILAINQLDNTNAVDKQYDIVNGESFSFQIVKNHTYEVYVLVTDGALCWDRVGDIVKIHEEADFTITGETEICVGGSLSLEPNVNNPDDSYKYEWKHDGTVVGSEAKLEINNLTDADAGEYELTISSAAGCPSSKSVNVVVNPLPVPEINGSTKICSNGTSTFSTTTNYKSYVWTVNGGADITTPTLTLKGEDYTPGSTVNITLVVTDNKGCESEPVTFTATVKQDVTITDAEATKDLACIGSSVTLAPTVTPAATYTYEWSESTGKLDLSSFTTAPITITDLPYPTSGSTYTITVKATDEDGCSATFDYTINMYKVEVVVTGQSPICNNSDADISWTATASVTPEIAATYTYDFTFVDETNSTLFTLNNAPGGVFTLTPSQISTLSQGTYQVIAKAHANIGGGIVCDSEESSFELKVLAKPDVSLTDNMPTCLDEEIVITAVAGYETYSFYVNGVEVQSNSNNVYKSKNLAEGDEIYVVIKGGNCEETSSTLTVTYQSEFKPTVSVDKPVVCANGSALFTVNSSTQNIAHVKVYRNDVVVSDEDITPSLSYTYNVENITADTRIKFDYTSETNCQFTSDEVTVLVCQITAGTIEGDEISCVNETATYELKETKDIHGDEDNFAAHPEEYTYSYTLTLDGVAQAAPASTTSTVDLTFNSTGVYELTATITETATGCTSTATKTINVVGLPVIDITSSYTLSADDKYYVCADRNFDITVSGILEGDKILLESATHGDLTFDAKSAESASTGDDLVALTTDGNGKIVFVYADDAKGVDDVWSVTLKRGTTGCVSEVHTVTVHNYAPIILSVPSPFTISGNTLQLCLGNSTTITASSLSDDATPDYQFSLDGGAAVNGTAFSITGEAIGTRVLKVTHENGCEVELRIETLEAPNPAADVTRYNDATDSYDPVAKTGEIFQVCSDDAVTITATGASRYTLTVDRNGEDVTSLFTDESSEAIFSQTLNLPYNEATAGGEEYSVYTLTYQMYVGTCADSKTITVYSYKMPDFTITASATYAIEGDDIEFNVTPTTYASYEFYLNDTKVNTDESVPSYTLLGITQDTTLTVSVSNEIGCKTTKTISVKVFEGIMPRDIVISEDYYCEGEGPATVSVVEPQLGVTYSVDNCLTCAPITYTDESVKVEWQVSVDNGIDLPGNIGKTQRFEVKASYDLIPGVVVDMNNYVDLIEYKLPQVKAIAPYNVEFNDCYESEERKIRLDDSEVGIRYYLVYDGEFDDEYDLEEGPYVGNGGTIKFKAPDKVGQYKVVGYQFDLNNGGTLCPIDMDGKVTVIIPDAKTFYVSSNPANGNYCSSQDGVSILLNGSEVGVDYYLMLNNVNVVVDGNPVMKVGDGNAIEFTNVKEPGKYSVMSINKGCYVPMVGVAEITLYQEPNEYTFTATNSGFYCYDGSGVELTVGGQDNGYLYTLFRDGNEIASVLGDDSGAPISWGDTITVAANYAVVVTIPDVTNGCALTLTDKVKVTRAEPEDIAFLQNETPIVCDGNSVDVRLLGTQIDEHSRYQLVIIEDDGSLTPYSELVTSYVNYVDFTVNQAIGAKTYGVYIETDYYDNADNKVLTCSKLSNETTKIVVVGSVSTGSEVVTHETPASVDDECYGEDIIIANAQAPYSIDDVDVDYIYTLYRFANITGDDDINNTDNYQIVNSYGSPLVASGNTSDDRFKDIRDNNGTYRIQVSNGYCDTWLPDVISITSDKYVTAQAVIAETEICHGDLGNTVTLAATEVGVKYTLMRVVGETAYDDDDVAVSATYTSNSTDPYVFETNSGDELYISEAGRYYVVGVSAISESSCPTYMGDFDFTTHPLPVSYQLIGKRDYCGDETGVTLKLASSEINTKYTLYSVTNTSDDAVLHPLQTLEGTGEELTFAEVQEGIYTAAAVNSFGCTSSMEGIIEVRNSPKIEKDETLLTDLIICGGNTATFSIEAEKLTAGLTYYLVYGNASPEAEDNSLVAKLKADGETNFVQEITRDGNYTLWASYDEYSCIEEFGTFKVAIDQIGNHNLLTTPSCDGTMTVYLEGHDEGIAYEVEFTLTDGTVTPRFPLDENYSYTFADGANVEYATAYAKTSNDCDVQMGANVYALVHDAVAGNLVFYMNGEQITDESKAQVCLGSNVSIIGSATNVNANKYIFRLVDEEGVEKARQENASNIYIPKKSDLEKFVTGSEDAVVTVVFGIDAGGCASDNVASFKFTIISPEFGDQRLFAKDVEGTEAHYCEGDLGVKLYYKKAEKNYTYRLYKVNDEELFDDIQDIQEIPIYSPYAQIDTLYFDGWGFNAGDQVNFARAGVYYVDVKDEDLGCTYRTNTFTVVEDTLPVSDKNIVYYEFIDENGKEYSDTKNENYGIVNGYIVLENAYKGVKYDLIKFENGDEPLKTDSVVVDGSRIFFGPIVENDSIYGEGLYTIRATDPTTGCYADLGAVEFLQDQLVAYDVYIFLSSSTNIVYQNLIPFKEAKGNHKYIDWSSKIDVVWQPPIDTAIVQGEPRMLDIDDDEYPSYKPENNNGNKTGYTAFERFANIQFQFDKAVQQVYKETKQIEIKLDGYELGCDSSLVVVGNDSTYRYFKLQEEPVYDLVTDSIYGEYGFYNLATDEKTTDSSYSGWFFYKRRPRFFGLETIPYHIVNTLMPAVRRSNMANIYILCGNAETGIDGKVFLIPNAFSPNGDGYNDTYEIIMPGDMAFDNTKLKVFNRWGTLVYESSGTQYGVDCPFWDGTSSTSNMVTVGTHLPSGTYFYVFQIDFVDETSGKTAHKELNGYIELRR